ncbi:MAG: hypothetical protein IJE78_15670 [Bacteroidaceae bacterium]|nr:hypothetical protein [Bacteroidaceae bacterium]
MKHNTYYIDIDVVYGIHKSALEEAARAATHTFLGDQYIQDKFNSDDFYNEMLEEGVRYIIQKSYLGKDFEELKSILFHHFMYYLKMHRRKGGNREQLMQQAMMVTDWYNAASVQEVSGTYYNPELELREGIAEFLECAPPELCRICEAFMYQDKKAVSKAEIARELGITEYELKKKLKEVKKILKNFLDF